MDGLAVVVLLLVGVAVLSPLADRIGLPAPVLVTAWGLVLAAIPGVPALHLPPELVLPVLLPPLLYAAATRSSTADLRRNVAALVLLAVGLVLFTTAAVAFTATRISPGLPLASAVVLGAIVSPPDPVAATSVAPAVGLPRRLVTVLEGEGMLNDSTALVVFGIALAAATGSHLSVGEASVRLLLSTVGATLWGLAVGWMTRRFVHRLDDPRAEVTATFLVPYLAYLPLDALNGSGVVAVVVAGLYLGQYGAAALSSAGRLEGVAVWNALDYALSGFAFALVGFEATRVLTDSDLPKHGIETALVVVLVVLVIRAVWVLPFGALLRRSRRFGTGSESWRESAVAAWAGMRGVVTIATALALPSDMPGHALVLAGAVAVVLVTLLGQGLTLPFVVRALKVGGQVSDAAEWRTVRARAAAGALARLEQLEAEGDVPPDVAQRLRERYEPQLAAQRVAEQRNGATEVSEELRSEAKRVKAARAAARERHALERALVEAERDVIIDLRRTGEVTPETAERALRDVDARQTWLSRR